MSTLVWDETGSRTFESGVDKGVLFLPDGSGVAWNGLVEVTEKFEKTVAAVYFDGMKIRDSVTLGDFSGSIKALTYPPEFEAFEGIGSLREGISIGDQPSPGFGLAYRNQVGNDIGGEAVGYIIHILYHLTAVPSDQTHATVKDTLDPLEFSWDISATPEELPGVRPTAHLIIDTRTIDPYLLSEIETMLYGDEDTDPDLPSLLDLFVYLRDWARLRITDHGDGTWTATEADAADGVFITMVTSDEFELDDVDSTDLGDDTYELTDTNL